MDRHLLKFWAWLRCVDYFVLELGCLVTVRKLLDLGFDASRVSQPAYVMLFFGGRIREVQSCSALTALTADLAQCAGATHARFSFNGRNGFINLWRRMKALSWPQFCLQTCVLMLNYALILPDQGCGTNTFLSLLLSSCWRWLSNVEPTIRNFISSASLKSLIESGAPSYGHFWSFWCVHSMSRSCSRDTDHRD